MNNAFAYSRNQETLLSARVSRRMHGACISVMRQLVIHANHTAREISGEAIERGEVLASLSHLEHWTGLTRQTIRTALNTLEKLNEISQKLTQRATRKPVVYVIVNYELWDDLSENQHTNQHRTNTELTTLKEVKEGKRIKKPYVASDEARACFRAWHQRRPLDVNQEPTYCKTFDDIHRIDKQSWEDIHAVCKYALTEWEAKHIQSPTKLRRPSSTYPEKKVYEVIRDQMQSKPEAPAVPTLEEMRKKMGVN